MSTIPAIVAIYTGKRFIIEEGRLLFKDHIPQLQFLRFQLESTFSSKRDAWDFRPVSLIFAISIVPKAFFDPRGTPRIPRFPKICDLNRKAPFSIQRDAWDFRDSCDLCDLNRKAISVIKLRDSWDVKDSFDLCDFHQKSDF
jgi:hypothetical protein